MDTVKPDSLDISKLLPVLQFSVTVILLLYSIFYVYHAVQVVTYPTQVNYLEGQILNYANRILAHQPLYNSLNTYPYDDVNYPPLHLWIMALLVHIFGKTMIAGRILSLTCIFTTSAFIYCIVNKCTRDSWVSFLSAGLFLGSSYVYYCGTLIRVDALGLVFSVAGIYLLIHKNARVRLTCAAILFLFALLTKHSFLSAPLAALVYLLIQRRTRDGMFFFILLSGMVILCFLVLNLATSWEIYKHLFIHVRKPYALGKVFTFLLDIAKNYPVLCLITVIHVIQVFKGKEPTLIVIYFLCTLPTLLSAGTLGADFNHVLEFFTVLCIITGIQLGTKMDNFSFAQRINVSWYLHIALLLQLLFIFHVPYRTSWAITPNEVMKQNARDLLKFVKKFQDPVISDDLSLLSLSGKPVLFQPFGLTQLALNGRWNQEPFLKDIIRQKFVTFIFMRNLEEEVIMGRLTNEMYGVIKKHYYLMNIIHGYHVYLPRETPILNE